jgi:hypothetical protein
VLTAKASQAAKLLLDLRIAKVTMPAAIANIIK